jgi:hypothetical protein
MLDPGYRCVMTQRQKTIRPETAAAAKVAALRCRFSSCDGEQPNPTTRRWSGLPPCECDPRASGRSVGRECKGICGRPAARLRRPKARQAASRKSKALSTSRPEPRRNQVLANAHKAASNSRSHVVDYVDYVGYAGYVASSGDRFPAGARGDAPGSYTESGPSSHHRCGREYPRVVRIGSALHKDA